MFGKILIVRLFLHLVIIYRWVKIEKFKGKPQTLSVFLVTMLYQLPLFSRPQSFFDNILEGGDLKRLFSDDFLVLR